MHESYEEHMKEGAKFLARLVKAKMMPTDTPIQDEAKTRTLLQIYVDMMTYLGEPINPKVTGLIDNDNIIKPNM